MKKVYLLYIYICIIFFDPIRAYTGISFLKVIGPLKELVLIGGLIALSYKKNIFKVRIETFNFFWYSLIFSLYILINSLRAPSILAVLANLKYYLWYLGGILFFSNYKKEELLKGLKVLSVLFCLYAFLTSFQQIFLPQTVRLFGRGGGTANPSILSYLYFSLSIFCYYYFKKIISFILFFSALLTFTKTFMISASLVIFIYIIFSKGKKKIYGIICVMILITIGGILINSSSYLRQSFGTAYRTVTYQEGQNNNSFELRKQRIEKYLGNRKFNFFIGKGFARAGNAPEFVREKLGIDYGNSTINTESMIFNTYLGLGIIGIVLLYFPIVVIGLYLIKKQKKECNLLVYILYFSNFMVFNLTLNMYEGFAEINIFNIFFVLAMKFLKEKEGNDERSYNII